MLILRVFFYLILIFKDNFKNIYIFIQKINTNFFLIAGIKFRLCVWLADAPPLGNIPNIKLGREKAYSIWKMKKLTPENLMRLTFFHSTPQFL